MARAMKPHRMRCRRCLYTDQHPFGIFFDTEGICSGCRLHEFKRLQSYENGLDSLGRLFGTPTAPSYDCVVPLRGLPECFAVVDILKNKLGLRVLGTIFNSQFNSSIAIRNFARVRESLDIDTLSFMANPLKYREMVRVSLEKNGSIRVPSIVGDQAFAVRTAIEYQVPFVVWPSHQATEQVGAFHYSELPEMSRADLESFGMMGQELTSLADVGSTISSEDLKAYRYPADEELVSAGVRGIYLSNYLPWDSRAESERAVNHLGALAGLNFRTFDTYDRVNDIAYMGLHDLLKQVKYGYGRVTDSLCREIRWGRVTREEALSLKSYFEAEWPEESLISLAEWLGTSMEGLLASVVNRHSAKGWVEETEAFADGFRMRNRSSPGPNEDWSAFVGGFNSNANGIWEDEAFELLGKGLAVSEEL